MKKNCLLLSLFLLALWGCDSPEKGSLDREILTKKAFECIRNCDEEKFRLLIPGREEYERYFHLKQMDKDMFEEEYAKMRDSLSIHFQTFCSSFSELGESVYANSKGDIQKDQNVSESTLITKIIVGEEVKKFSFNANKLNGRWYITGDFHWIQ